MQIESLKYVSEIAKTGSITRAAKNLYITQPYLSRILKEVEQQCGIVIFQRTPKGVALTQDGKEFMDKVNQLLGRYQSLEESFITAKQKKATTLKIATQRDCPVVSAFLEFYEKNAAREEYIQLAIYEENLESIVRMVGQKACNIGVVHVPKSGEKTFLNTLRESGIKGILLDESPVCVLMGKSHPLAVQQEVSLEELQSYPYITFEDDVSNIILDSVNLQKQIVVQNFGMLHLLIARTNAYHLGTDLSHGRNLLPEELHCIPLVNTTERICTYWLCTDKVEMTAFETALLDIYRSQKDRVI